MSDSQHKFNKTMDNSGCPSSSHQSGSLRGQGDPSPVPPQHAASVPTSAVVKNAVKFRHTGGGKSINLPLSGTAWTWQSAAMAIVIIAIFAFFSLLLLLLLLDQPQPIVRHGASLPFSCCSTAASVFLIVE
jgi:hypothetical protein